MKQQQHPDDEDETVEIPDLLSQWFESLVGVFMIVLGLYGVRRAFDNRMEYQRCLTSPEEQVDNETNAIDDDDDNDDDKEEEEAEWIWKKMHRVLKLRPKRER